MTGRHDAAGIFHEPLYVEFRDTDRDQHVRLTTWLAWLAGLAGDDYEGRNLGRDELIRRGQVFLINRFALKVRRMPRCYESLRAMTWEHGTQTIFFNRHYAFESLSGERLADARSTWLLCDPVNHRILRPKAFGEEVRNIDRAIDCPEIEQLAAPETASPLGEYVIRYSDLDANDHVYCANYGHIVADHLPEPLVHRPINTFEITYVKEALLGEAIALFGADTPGGYVLYGNHHANGQQCFICRLTFSEHTEV